MSTRRFLAVAAVTGIMTVGFVVVVLDDSGSPAQAATSCTAAASLSSAHAPAGGVAGFDADQMTNAQAIMNAAKVLGLPVAAQLIGLQAAIGESTLRVIDHGDGAGPDSRGLFQQRAAGWGSYEDRMNPTISSANFFKALQRVEGWQTLEPTIAIHRTQRNADPNHYTKFRAQATEVLKALGGEAAAGVDASGTCPADGSQVVGDLAGKWVKPMAAGINTSGYGPRQAPAGTAGGVLANFHYGIDFSTPGHAGTIVAITDMKIVKIRNLDGTFGTGITGQSTDGKLTIGMYHMEAGSVRVKEGDTVAAGTPLGTEGATGNVTGRHLHMEFFAGALPNPMVPVNPTIDPTPILKEKGIL